MMKVVLVPLFMFLASCLMSLAWLGHLRFRDSISFWAALALSWLRASGQGNSTFFYTQFNYTF